MKEKIPSLLAFLTVTAATYAVRGEFPDMKTLLILAVASAALLLTGCTSGFAAKLNKLPDGAFTSAKLEETDKFTSTTIALTGVTKDNGELSAASIAIDHTNPWVTKFHFEAENYQAQLSRTEQKKKLVPMAATKAAAPVATSDAATPAPPATTAR